MSLRPFLTPALALVPEQNVLAGRVNKIQVEQLNPTKYEIKVSAESPYNLVLNNRFNSNWRISDADGDKTHFTINGFANAWDIQKTGEYSLIVEYSPQRFFYIGWIITISFMSAMVIFLLYAIFKHK